MSPQSKKVAMNFNTMQQVDVPQGRNGKHKGIVTRILSDLDQVQKGVALKVPLAQLTDSKEKVRSGISTIRSQAESVMGRAQQQATGTEGNI